MRGQTLVLFEAMHLITRFMRFFFHHFYHTFAWTYDFVSAFVSIGRWQDWIKTVLPFIQGTRILEIGYGPGHLQRILLDPSTSLTVRAASNGGTPVRDGRTGRKLLAVGLDESRQMAYLAKRRLDGPASLTRGLAQSLPFSAQTFDTVVSTFPAEYIFDPRTLSDVYRVLHNGGRFIVLPFAWIVGKKTLDRFAAWLFRVTGETPRNVMEIISQRAVHPLEKVGFEVEVKQVEIKSSVVVIVTAQKR